MKVLFWAVSEALRFKRKRGTNLVKSPCKGLVWGWDGGLLDKAIAAEAWDYESKSLALIWKLGTEACTCDPGSGEVETGGSLGSLTCQFQLNQWGQVWSKDPFVKRVQWRVGVRHSILHTCGAHMGEHTYLYTTSKYKEQKKEKKNCDFCPLGCVMSTFKKFGWLKSWSSFD